MGKGIFLAEIMMADTAESFLVLYSSMPFYLSGPPVLQNPMIYAACQGVQCSITSTPEGLHRILHPANFTSSYALLWPTSRSDNMYHVSSRDRRISGTLKKEILSLSLIYTHVHTHIDSTAAANAYTGSDSPIFQPSLLPVSFGHAPIGHQRYIYLLLTSLFIALLHIGCRSPVFLYWPQWWWGGMIEKLNVLEFVSSQRYVMAKMW